MSAQFSEGWSGTPMWQIKEQREEQQRKELRELEAQAGDVLSIDVEGDAYRSVLVVSRLVDGTFKDTKVRGPQRRCRAEAVKDGLELRAACRKAEPDEKVAAAIRRKRGLIGKSWAPHELPREDTAVEEKHEERMRIRLASKPRGTGWQRVGDKEFFRHVHAPMAFDPKKRRYMILDEPSNTYRESDPPHDPFEYAVSVNASASMVGSSDAALTDPLRPRTLLLKELIKTGSAMKNPLFFLDQPAACFVLFDGVRGGSAAEWCSKHFHTKLLPRLGAWIQYWSDALVKDLLSSILEELDTQLLQQQGCCWDGVSVAVALLLGNRLAVASLGAVRCLLLTPDGSSRALSGEHEASCTSEQLRVQEAGAEVIHAETGAPRVRKTVKTREWQAAESNSPEDEVQRILQGTSDAFATLCFDIEDTVDGKAARSTYKKLALKVHPDKVAEELKTSAKDAFEKVEAAAAAVEAFCEADAEAATELHRVLHAAAATGNVMPKSKAATVLGISEEVGLEEAQRRASELKERLKLLGMRADGNFAFPEQERAAWLVDEAVEAYAAPAMKDEGATLEPVKATRALGLRDLKFPRPIVVASSQVEIVQLEGEGAHHLAMVSDGVSVLSNDEVLERIRIFKKQPKAASLLVAADAAARASKQGAKGTAQFASCVVAAFDVTLDDVEPTAKRPRKEGTDKVRARHILLKHKDLKTKIDSHARLQQRGPITRPLAQAERELLQLKQTLTKDMNQFHVLARKHSECQSALQPGQLAGDMGWVSRGSLGDPAFEEAILGLDLHELSDLISTSRGVHIVYRYA